MGTNSAGSTLAPRIHDAVISFVKPAEVYRTEEDGPDAVIDFLQADVLVQEEPADAYFAALPANRLVLGHQADLEVIRVGEVHRLVGPGARCIRSCLPFCCGFPGSIRSGVMPSLTQWTERRERAPSPTGDAKG